MEDNKKKGLGMVLEGGGMRGLYTAGVLDELMEQGIYADSTVGVSAGAIFGCNYKSRSEPHPSAWHGFLQAVRSIQCEVPVPPLPAL